MRIAKRWRGRFTIIMKLGLVLAALVSLAGAAGCSPATPAAFSATTTRPLVPAPPPLYRLDFTINATDGGNGSTVVADRHYTIVLQRGEEGRLHTGSNVSLSATEASPRVDAGTTVRCKYEVDGDDLRLHAVLELSNVGSAGASPQPQIHKIEVIGDALVKPGAQALVATIADPTTRSHYQLNVSATRLQ